MELNTIVQDIHRISHQLETFERKYGIMSETFYESYSIGEEPEEDSWVMDFEKWAGLYEVWKDRQNAYKKAIDTIRSKQSSLSEIIHTVKV